MKKTMKLIISLVLVVAMITGCSSKNNNGDNQGNNNAEVTQPVTDNKTTKPVTIKYYGGWTGADLEKMQALVDQFNGSQDKIKVEFTSLQWSEMFTKFLADYQVNSSPDIVAMHSFEMGQFVEMGVLSADQVTALGLNKADYVETAWNGTIYDEVQYGVPLDINMHALYYNKDLFAKAGIENPPTTGEELIEVAQKLTIDKNGKNASEAGFDPANIVQYGFGFLQNHHGFYQMYALLNQQGYNPFTSDLTELTLDVDKTSNAIQFIEDLLYKYHVTPIGEKSAIDDFKAGNVAMAIDGNWQLSGMSQVEFNWATAEYPNIFGEKAVWGASELIAFPSNINDENRKAAAKEFAVWLAENSAEWALSGQIPANIKAQEASKKLEGIEAYYNELDYVKFIPAHPKAVSIFSSSAPSPILTMAQDATLNNKNAQDIVKQFEIDVNNVLKQQ